MAQYGLDHLKYDGSADTWEIRDAKNRGNIAPAYSASSTYAVGDHVLYNGQLYECNTAIATAEAWTAAHWTAVTVSEKIADLEDETSSLKEDLSDVVLHPSLRNGTIGNLNNQNAVALEYIQEYNDATAIKIMINRPLSSSGDHYVLVFSTYTINNAVTANNGSYRVTLDRFIPLEDNFIYIKKGYFDNTSVGWAFHILEEDSSGNRIPLRTTDFGSDGIVIAYDYSDLSGLQNDTSELRNDVNNIYKRKVFPCAPSTTISTNTSISVGDTFKIINNTSGSITPQIYSGSTMVAIFPQITAGKSATICSTANGDSLKAYCTSSVVNGETVEFIWGNTVVGEMPSIYYCMKDGSGDFTTLVDAVRTATQKMDSTVYVGAGEWDVLSELGSEFLNNVSPDPSTWGLILKNRIHLVFANGSKVVANYTGNIANVNKYFSVFNTGAYGFFLENCTIESKNIRYCVHDDPGLTTPYHNKYLNCKMYHDNSTNQNFGGWGCIGGGFGKDSYIEVVGCDFDAKNQYGNVGGVVSYHNSYMANAKSKLFIKDSVCHGNYTFRVSWHGASTEISDAYITNCKIGSAIIYSKESQDDEIVNVELTEWNNQIGT